MKRERPAPPVPEPAGDLIDAHTHLDACGVHDDASLAAVLDRAGRAGVGRVVTIADDLEAARFAVRAAHWDERVHAAVALHPTRANALDDAARAELEALAADDRVVAVGETGLDWYWPGKMDGCAERGDQLEAFAWHIDLAKRTGLPLMIHNREADDEVLAVLASEGAPDTVIFHCFSSGPETARRCVDAGYVLSFSGTVSFRNAKELHAAAAIPPDDGFLLETDAPFLTPHPYRGAPNEPYCLPYTARALAHLRGVSAEEIAACTTANAERVYGSRGRDLHL
ncbi:TatD family hydrolase [Tomitella cavernea]|uniref:TatD family hydrolase n=1 Tax=Tomitella cavernea TaxID=1387982 RepID=A0ABP9CIQ0_9ACTN|nr:TatD family hydrolase [Tomitella cavernea]